MNDAQVHNFRMFRKHMRGMSKAERRNCTDIARAGPAATLLAVAVKAVQENYAIYPAKP